MASLSLSLSFAKSLSTLRLLSLVVVVVNIVCIHTHSTGTGTATGTGGSTPHQHQHQHQHHQGTNTFAFHEEKKQHEEKKHHLHHISHPHANGHYQPQQFSAEDDDLVFQSSINTDPYHNQNSNAGVDLATGSSSISGTSGSGRKKRLKKSSHSHGRSGSGGDTGSNGDTILGSSETDNGIAFGESRSVVFDIDGGSSEDQVQEGVDNLFSELLHTGTDDSGSAAAGTKPKKHKYKNADKKEIARLRKLVMEAKSHQAKEVEKLMALRKGVEALVSSLNGTRTSLQKAKRESSNMELELETLHKQAAAASELERELIEIQTNARINYETGKVELKRLSESGELRLASLPLDEVTKRVQLELHGGELPANLADPAVLHADLQLLLDIVVLLCSATIGGMIAALVSLPPLIGYIVGGITVGPSGLGYVEQVVEVDTLAQFGSVFFLFAHGLEYTWSDQKQFHSVSVFGCILATFLSAFGIQIYVLMSGIVSSPMEGGLLGLSTSLSSLSIVLSYLHDQNLLHSIHGKVMVGFLTSQGVMMGFVFSIPPALSSGATTMAGISLAFLRACLSGLVVIVCGYFFARKPMPALLRILNKNEQTSSFDSEELYLLAVVSLAMVMALLTEFLGLSLDLGAFFAGLMLAGTPYMERTAKAVQPLASVFAAMLFASIGMIFNFSFFYNNLGSIIVVVLQIVLVKVLVVTTVVRLFNYSWETAIHAGVGLGHVGEFSLLFSSKLHAHNLLSRRVYLLFLAATITTLVSAPLALRLYKVVAPRILRLFLSSTKAYK